MPNDEKNPKSDFSTPQKCTDVLEICQNIENQRALDRSKINNLFNGKVPYTPVEEEKNNIQINVNWGYGKNIARDANNQLNGATNHRGMLFNCSLQEGRVDKRDEWSQKFTQLIHKPLQVGKSGKAYYYAIKNRNATIAMHGIGALLWPNDFKWMPRFVALEDLLIPTETYCDFSNLRYFGVNYYLTPGELVKMTKGDNVKPGWNQTMVNEILDAQVGQVNQGTPGTWLNQPEAMMQIYKENQGWYTSDIIPKIRLRGFYYTHVDQPDKWYRHILLREAYGEAKPGDKFLFNGSNSPFASDINQVLNVQYGDNNFVAPLKYHAVRGIGVDLFAAVETLNRLQCQTVQATFEQLLMYFRIQDPADRDRLKQVVLSAYGVLPEGLNIVPRDQRHQIDPNLVNMSMALIRQNMQETSSAYVSDPDNGTQKEMTAREATIKLNQANAMVSGMIQSVLMQEAFLYSELVRRFCNKTSNDPEVREFQAQCQRAGIPDDLIRYDAWKVTPERVLGGGDRTQAQAEVEYLLSVRNLHDPVSQQKILRIADSVMLSDPAKAEMLVPQAKPQATDGVLAAENVFGTLMMGQQCVPRQGIDQEGYITAMIKMMANVVSRIQNTDNMGTVEDLAGLNTVAANIATHIDLLAQDPNKKEQVKISGDMLGQLTNKVKGFQQRLEEKMQSDQANSMQNPEVAAKVQGMVQQAETKMKITEATAAQKLEQKEAAFQQRMNQDLEKHTLQMEKMIADAKAEMIAAGLKTGQEIHDKGKKTDAEVEAAKKKSDAANKPVDKSG